MDYDRFLNTVSTNRTYSPLRKVWSVQHRAGPKMISLGTGAPNPQCFPFESVVIKTKDGKTISLEGQDLHTALSYTDSLGLPPLIDWLHAFQKRLHDPPYARADPSLNQIIVTPGSQDGLCKVLEMLLEAGDTVLVPEPAYPGALSAMRPMRVSFLPVKMDEHGVEPESMRKVLEDQTKSNEPMPKLLVIQPNHCNPSGISTTLQRRQEIYDLACKYDILIIEDDPYYFLTFDNLHSDRWLPPPSFLSLDTEGRVLRLESFSKVVSAGLRIGTLSGPRPLIQRVMMHIDCSSLHASTFTQTMLYRLLLEYGQDGFLAHGRSVAEFYKDRCNNMIEAAEGHLSGLATWHQPTGGMFLWIKLIDVSDTQRMIMDKALKKMVMLTPGNVFMCDDMQPTSFLRCSFSWASQEQMNEGFRRLAEMIAEDKICRKQILSRSDSCIA